MYLKRRQDFFQALNKILSSFLSPLQPRKASATCSSATAAASSGLEEWSARSPRHRSSAPSPENPDPAHSDPAPKPPSPAGAALALSKPPSPCAPGMPRSITPHTHMQFCCCCSCESVCTLHCVFVTPCTTQAILSKWFFGKTVPFYLFWALDTNCVKVDARV